MRHKTHMADAAEFDGILAPPLCRQRTRTLLPPAVATDWAAVTCDRCLSHRPPPPVGPVTAFLRRWMARLQGRG